ncbi:MAG: NAD(P)/FAD-dependent oxidoreductase [Synechococcaceae bacterium WB9_4xB_025]|nr:NAD(P)/FAD-dependent oxidoreductase [Synechococcaceae bacterium WB9_4xB_025]
MAERFFLELESPETSSWPHVVVVGGGFAGLRVCRALKGAKVRVTLIDKRNFNLFAPLLYQVATGLVSRGDVAIPLRMLVGDQANLQILLGEVTQIDPAERSIAFNGTHLRYDHLVLATGSGSTYLGHEEWRALAPPMKILEHAEEIRRRLLMALEEAERTVDAKQRQFLQTVVVVGSGPSGCELAGSVAELMRRALAKDFRRVDPEQTRVVLVVSGGRVLKELPELLSEAAAANLRAKGVELVQGRVSDMQPGAVVIRCADGGERVVQAANVFWTAGVRASKLGQRLAEATGCELDRGGRVMVEPDFSIAGHPEIRVIGDLCHYAHASADGQAIPGMAGPATQMGQWVGRDLRAQLEGRPHQPFRYVDFGSMAVLGRWSAVANLRGIKLAGFPGWVLWALAHLASMPDDENRITLLVKWLWAIVSEQRSSLLITGLPNDNQPGQGPAPFPMGWENEPSFADLLGPMAEAVEQFQRREHERTLSEC